MRTSVLPPERGEAAAGGTGGALAPGSARRGSSIATRACAAHSPRWHTSVSRECTGFEDQGFVVAVAKGRHLGAARRVWPGKAVA